MTDDRSLERAARSWLEEGPTRAPDRPVDAALARIQTTAQERDLRIPWRFPPMNPITRIAAVAAVLAVAVGVALFAWRPTSQVGPPSSPTPAPPTIEGTWDVSFTREEMLAAGIVDQGEDNPGNFGHFRLSFGPGRWRMVQLGPPTSGGGNSTYTVDAGVAHLYSPMDITTFDIPYTVTETSLTFGRGGPVTFRVKPWTRVATEPIPSAAAGPLANGVYDGPTLQVADIMAAVDADTTLKATDRTQVIDVYLAIRGHKTLRISIELLDGQLFQRETVDAVSAIGSFGQFVLPDDQTLRYTEGGNAAGVVTDFDLSVEGGSFTLHRTTPAHGAADEFVTRLIFESGPFVLR